MFTTNSAETQARIFRPFSPPVAFALSVAFTLALLAAVAFTVLFVAPHLAGVFHALAHTVSASVSSIIRPSACGNLPGSCY